MMTDEDKKELAKTREEAEAEYRSKCIKTNEVFKAYRESGFGDSFVEKLADATREETAALERLENPMGAWDGGYPVSRQGKVGAKVRSQVAKLFS